MKYATLTLSALGVFAGLTFAAPQAGAAAATANCAIMGIASLADRIHIQCQAVPHPHNATPPDYVAVEASSPTAQTTVQIALAALTRTKIVQVIFDNDARANPPNCDPKNCRRLLGVVIH